MPSVDFKMATKYLRFLPTKPPVRDWMFQFMREHIKDKCPEKPSLERDLDLEIATQHFEKYQKDIQKLVDLMYEMKENELDKLMKSFG